RTSYRSPPLIPNELTQNFLQAPDKEVISLSFSEYLEEYTPQNEIGSGLGAVKQGYDIVKNKKL
ncbi:hypothetical protein, partial [Limnobacter litoralis]|uniref:hypothetical protein n=1 Tax=Limnobacter litoralis TaxID=481366 RepID=UPI003D674A7E